MFKLKRAQTEVFKARAIEMFEERVVAHVREFFPEACARLGEEGLHRVFEKGLERAKRYDLWTERGACFYVDLMLEHGEDFDAAPEHAWAREVFAAHHDSTDVRLDALQSAAVRYQAAR